MTRTDYFKDCRTSDEIKTHYRLLAREHHPDLGGETAVMREINRQYAIAMDGALRAERPGRTEEQYADMADVAESIRRAVERVIHLPNIEIELVGTWVWVAGHTKPVKEALKEAGYRWAPKKDGQPWYFAGVPSRNRGRKYSMDEIRSRYGSQRIEREEGRPQRAFAAQPL